MKSLTRKFLLFVMALAFMITVPMVLLSTAGYRLNLLKNRVEKTGILEVESSPSGASVFLNGDLQSSVTPTSLRRLLPEDYNVRISLDGYLDWNKRLSVESGLTTFTSRVDLLKDTLPSLVETGMFKSVSWTPDAIRLAAISEETGWQELVVWNRVSKATESLSRYPDDDVISNELVWSPDGQKLMHVRNTVDGTTAIVYSPGTTRTPWTATKPLPVGHYRAKWSSDSQNVLFIGEDGAFLLAVNGQSAVPLAIGKGVLDAAARDRQALILRRGESDNGESVLERTDWPGGKSETVALLPSSANEIFEWRGATALISDDRLSRITLVETTTGARQNVNGTNLKRWENGDSYVSWNDFEVHIGNLNDDVAQVVTRLGEKIVGCDWHPNGNIIICATDRRIFATETDGRNGRNTWTLASGGEISGLSIDKVGNKIYFMSVIGQSKGIFERPL